MYKHPSNVQATCHALEKYIQVGSYKKLFTDDNTNPFIHAGMTPIISSFIQGRLLHLGTSMLGVGSMHLKLMCNFALSL